MNVLSLILSRSYYYCFCEKFEGPHLEFSGLRKWTLCCIPIIFNDFEKILDYNANNYVFLKTYHAHLFPYLIEIFDVNKGAIDCFFKDNFVYLERDWSSGQKWSVT